MVIFFKILAIIQILAALDIIFTNKKYFFERVTGYFIAFYNLIVGLIIFTF